MSLGPDREPINQPVFVWLEIGAQLVAHGDGSLAAVQMKPPHQSGYSPIRA